MLYKCLTCSGNSVFYDVMHRIPSLTCSEPGCAANIAIYSNSKLHYSNKRRTNASISKYSKRPVWQVHKHSTTNLPHRTAPLDVYWVQRRWGRSTWCAVSCVEEPACLARGHRARAPPCLSCPGSRLHWTYQPCSYNEQSIHHSDRDSSSPARQTP